MPQERFTSMPLTLTLPLQIADRLANGIVEEQFAPGERLKETELSAAFGVSRATIREALRILENRGLATIQPQHGAHVAKLSRQELEDMFDIRIVLLGLASRTVAERLTADHARRLQDALAALMAAREDASAYAGASARMSLLMADLSGNGQLAEHLKSFAQHIGRYARLGFVTAARREQSLRSWRKLLKAILARDGQAAESLHRKLSQANRAAALAEFDRRESQLPDPPARRAAD